MAKKTQIEERVPYLHPLRVNGKRDPRKRFLDTRTNKVISYRDALNLSEQTQGYENYGDFIRKRKEAGTSRKRRSDHITERKPLNNGEAYIWEFEKHGKTGITIPRKLEQENLAGIDKFIREANGDLTFQLYYRANQYSSGSPPDMWGWSSTTPQEVDSFREMFYARSDNSILEFLYKFNDVRPYIFPDEKDVFPEGYSYRMHGKQIAGVLEFQIVIWDDLMGNHGRRDG